MQLFNNLSSPFPYTRGLTTETFSALRACILATLILFLLRPFGLGEASISIILGFGIVVFLSALLNIIVALYVFRKFINEERWTVWKEILRTLIYLSINVIVILFFANRALSIQLNQLVIFKFIGFTILFATVPISIRTISVKNLLLKQRLREAQDLAKIIEDKPIKNDPLNGIILKSNIVNDVVTTNCKDLLFIEAEKNYIAIVDRKQGEINKTLLRLSLIKAYEQIKNDSIIRCHRSYLVNINAVRKVTGNSQGLKLVFFDELQPIPVSRSYKEEVMRKISQLHSK